MRLPLAVAKEIYVLSLSHCDVCVLGGGGGSV